MIRFVDMMLVSYLLGAIPSGMMAGRLTGGIDVTKYGSGKTGTANVLRAAGKKAAVITGAGDLLKGAVAVLLTRPILSTETITIGTTTLGIQSAQAMAGVLVILGHNWSIFLKFRGGSGVTSFFGGLLVLNWPTALLGGTILILITALTRYVSLGSMIGTTSSFITTLVLLLMQEQPLEYVIYTGIATGLILFKHRDNIRRLQSKTERKLGQAVAIEQSPDSEN